MFTLCSLVSLYKSDVCTKVMRARRVWGRRRMYTPFALWCPERGRHFHLGQQQQGRSDIMRTERQQSRTGVRACRVRSSAGNISVCCMRRSVLLHACERSVKREDAKMGTVAVWGSGWRRHRHLGQQQQGRFDIVHTERQHSRRCAPACRGRSSAGSICACLDRCCCLAAGACV